MTYRDDGGSCSGVEAENSVADYVERDASQPEHLSYVSDLLETDLALLKDYSRCVRRMDLDGMEEGIVRPLHSTLRGLSRIDCRGVENLTPALEEKLKAIDELRVWLDPPQAEIASMNAAFGTAPTRAAQEVASSSACTYQRVD